MTRRTRQTRRPPVSRDTVLFALGVAVVIFQQWTGRVSIPLLIFAGCATLAPGTLQLFAPILQAYMAGTAGTSQLPPSSSSPPSSPPPSSS